jgi:hypothetical protein
MKRLNLILSVYFMLCGFVVLAQPSSEMPPNGEAGKCYAKCLIADQYETVAEKVETKAAGVRTEVIPATFETVTEQVIVKAAASRMVATPAEYETVTEQVMVTPEKTKLVAVPAV